MKLYHYTPIKNWPSIRQNGLNSWPIGTEYPLAKTQRSVFMLLSPEPENWKTNPHFPITWKTLLVDRWNLLLEIDDDNLHPFSVVDRWHIEWYAYQLQKNTMKKHGWNIPEKYKHTKLLRAEEDYSGSKIPLLDYLNSEEYRTTYSIPEVISEGNIPASSIQVSSSQPRCINPDWTLRDPSILTIPPFRDQLGFSRSRE